MSTFFCCKIQCNCSDIQPAAAGPAPAMGMKKPKTAVMEREVIQQVAQATLPRLAPPKPDLLFIPHVIDVKEGCGIEKPITESAVTAPLVDPEPALLPGAIDIAATFFPPAPSEK